MGYQTGVANNIEDLLDKFRLFAIDEGWTVNRWATQLSGRALCIQKAGMFFNFHAGENISMIINGSTSSGRSAIRINGSDGYDGSAQWDRQPGHPVRTSGTTGPTGTNQGHCSVPMYFNAGPYPAYHFFSFDDKTLHCEIEVTTGRFLRFGCGALDLFNPAAPGGGRYCYGVDGGYPSDSETGSNTWLNPSTNGDNSAIGANGGTPELYPGRLADYSSNNNRSGAHLRCAFGSFDNWAGSGRAGYTFLQQEFQGGGCHDGVLRDYSPDPINNIGVLLPNMFAINRGNEFLQPVGIVPGMRMMDMTNYLPGDEFTLGPDTWKVFPWFQKGSHVSQQRGIALLKVED